MNMSSEIKKIYPTLPNEYPTKENVVGTAKEFIDELEEGMDYSGIYNSLGIKPDRDFWNGQYSGIEKKV